MPWQGKPKWSGEYASFGPVDGKLFPVVNGEPFLIAIEGSNDLFFMLFSTEEKLHATTEKFIAKLTAGGLPIPYDIGIVKDTEMVDALIEMKVRMMCDPVVIDDHHTNWTEIVRQGDIYKYADPENN